MTQSLCFHTTFYFSNTVIMRSSIVLSHEIDAMNRRDMTENRFGGVGTNGRDEISSANPGNWS